MRMQPTDTAVVQLQPVRLPASEAGTAITPAAIAAGPPQADLSPIASAKGEGQGGSFADLLGEALHTVNSIQQDADLAAERVATGDAEHLHEAIIAMEKADLALRITVQVTQRAIEAYKEVAHMQL
jgi:flagellar hook-basal body complex protein FliE